MTISINYRIPDQPGARYNTAQRGPGPVLMMRAWPCRRSRHIGFSRTFLPIFGATRLGPDTSAINFRSDAIFLGSWNIGFINFGRGWVLLKLFRALDGSCDLSHSQQGCGLAPGSKHKIMREGGLDLSFSNDYPTKEINLCMVTFYQAWSIF